MMRIGKALMGRSFNSSFAGTIGGELSYPPHRFDLMKLDCKVRIDRRM